MVRAHIMGSRRRGRRLPRLLADVARDQLLGRRSRARGSEQEVTTLNDLEWVRKNYTAFGPIDPSWSPEMVRECRTINKAARKPSAAKVRELIHTPYRSVKITDDLHRRLRIKSVTDRVLMQDLIEQLLEAGLRWPNKSHLAKRHELKESDHPASGVKKKVKKS
jgi:hypothetical protein